MSLTDQIKALTGKLGAADRNAKVAAFVEQLFAGLEGFDFCAALEAGNDKALAEHVASIAQQRDDAKAALQESQAALQELLGALDLQLDAAGQPTKDLAAAAAQAVAAKANRQAVAITAKAGIQQTIKGEQGGADPHLSLLDKYNEMPPGKAKIQFLAAHKEELWEAARANYHSFGRN